MKTVFAPHLQKHVKMGRRRPMPGAPSLKLRRYLHLALPAPPASCDYSSKAAAVLANIYGNDSLGDCVIAGGYHTIGVETGNAGNLFTATDAQIIADYSAIGGYIPGDPGTDAGCDEQTALAYWTSKGFADGSKLLGWLKVDATNQTEVKAALFLFENLLLGIELPDAWVNPFPSGPGFTWDDGTPDPNNGHACVATGYDVTGVQVATWGLIGTITWTALAHLCAPGGGGELYVMLTPDQLARSAVKAPNGVFWASLIADFDEMGGHVPIPAPSPQPPAPSPAPAPAPVPVAAAVTLQQATAWAVAGIASHSGPLLTRSTAEHLATQGLTKNWPK